MRLRYVAEHGFQRQDLTRKEFAILSRLREAKGTWVHREEFIDLLYGDDPEGGPMCAEECIRMCIYRLRRKLAGWPYAIKSRPGRCSPGWRLE